MDITRNRVVAQVQPSSHLNGFAEPHILIHRDENEPTLTIENCSSLNYDGDLLKSEYRVSRCLSNFDYDTEVKFLVNTVLNGYDAAAIFMSACTTNTYQKRQDTVHELLMDLDSRIEKLNKQNYGDSPMKIEFAYIGITDDSCYDMHTHRPLKNSKVLELGLVASMKSVKSAKQVWDKVKSGSRFPSVLGVRLSDESKLLGTLVIADLLQPWSKEDASIRYSFNKNLLDLVDRRSEEGFYGPLPIDTCVLTKLLGPYFCGLGKATFIIQVDEYPRESIDATLNVLNLSQKLYNIRSIAMRNEPEASSYTYRKAEKEKKQLSDENHSLERNIKALERNTQTLQKKYQQEEKQNQVIMGSLEQRIEALNKELHLALEREKQYKKTISSNTLHAAEMDFLASSSEFQNLKLERKLQEYRVEIERSNYTTMKLRIKLADMMQQLQDMEEYAEHVSTEAQSARASTEETDEKIKSLTADLSEARADKNELEKEIKRLQDEVRRQKRQVNEQKDEVNEQKENVKEEVEKLKKKVNKLNEEVSNRKNEIKEQEAFFKDREKGLQDDLEFITDHAQHLTDENENLKMTAVKLKQKSDQLKKKLAEVNGSDQLSNHEREEYESAIKQWKMRARNAEKQLNIRKIKDDDDESEEEEVEPPRRNALSKRISAISPRTTNSSDDADFEKKPKTERRVVAKKNGSMWISYAAEDVPIQDSDFKPVALPKKKVKEAPPPKTDPPRRRGRPRKKKPEDQPPENKESAAEEPKPDTTERSLQPAAADEPERNESKGQTPELENEDMQSPVMEYEVEPKMPEDTPEEEEEQEVVEKETTPPRKKRKLRDSKRKIDYDTEFLSPLSKVNHTLKDDS